MIANLNLTTVTECIKFLDKVHSKKDPLKINRVKVHEHLGMKVDTSAKVGFVITSVFVLNRCGIIQIET